MASDDVRVRIEAAFDELSQLDGFELRDHQVQLALFVSDLIGEKSSGAIEAPTGLGKSLALLVAALAHIEVHETRILIATYTNVLAEQYWRKDVQFALKLFPEVLRTDVKFQIGRQRYACLASFEDNVSEHREAFQDFAELGIETEFRQFARNNRLSPQLWSKLSVPPVCPARQCPAYEDCFYYRGRKEAEKAKLVITNHSVVIQDALMATSEESNDGLLGSYDVALIDEAHDFVQAAQNGLEFELSASKLQSLRQVSGRLESLYLPTAQAVGHGKEWLSSTGKLKEGLDEAERTLLAYGLSENGGGILCASPSELNDHPQIEQMRVQDRGEMARSIANKVSHSCRTYLIAVDEFIKEWKELRPEMVKPVQETAHTYKRYLSDFAEGAQLVLEPDGVSVSYVNHSGSDAKLRRDLVDLQPPLKSLLWDRKPCVLVSATLAVDSDFTFLERSVGFKADHCEILPSPFDHAEQSAIYMPPAGHIPDPSQARKERTEGLYISKIASELSKIITLMQGRTLALFHSRKEMEAVYAQMSVPPELPILIQGRFGTGDIGEKFRRVPEASLFGLRSFWTGFDAPGDTLSAVVIVRIPFEVPIDPQAVARMVHLANQGLNPFAEWTIPMAKMMVRQGAGRLIRKETDRGVIALLDPRLRTKPYGESFLENLPQGMRTFDDFEEAAAHLQLLPP